MNSNTIIETNGSITKTETLLPIDYQILNNTVVAEAMFPYADYYGKMPQKITPNSLFLFTKQFYTLEELLKVKHIISRTFEEINNLDVAAAIFDFVDHYQYAIRIKELADYDKVKKIQTWFGSKGILFSKKFHLLQKAKVTVFKRFAVTEIEDQILLDKTNKHKGYVIIPGQISNEEFDEILINLRNNHDCPLFDAALGTIGLHNATKDIVRIYSENINLDLLYCAKKRFSGFLANDVHLMVKKN